MPKESKALDTKKGIAGLDIVMGVVATVFVMGILVMLFVLVSSQMQDQTTDASAIQVINDTGVAIGSTSDWFGIIILVGIIVGILGLVSLVIVLLRRSGMF